MMCKLLAMIILAVCDITIHMSICLSIYLSISVCDFLSMIVLAVCDIIIIGYTYLSVVYLSVVYLSVYLSVYLFVVNRVAKIHSICYDIGHFRQFVLQLKAHLENMTYITTNPMILRHPVSILYPNV